MQLRLVALTIPVALALVAPVAHGQGGPSRFGVTAGVNFAKLDGDETEGPIDTRTSWMAGVFASRELHPNFAVEGAVLFSEQGAKGSVFEEGVGFDAELKLRYLQIPVLGKLMMSPMGARQVRPFVTAGPALGINIGCRVAIESDDLDVENDCDAEDGPEVKTIDFSAVFGGGIDFGGLTVGLRYWLGLTSIDDSDEETVDVKNRVISLFASLNLGGGR
jgi:hypothetical protein